MKNILLVTSLVTLAACAKATHEIPTQYVSPLQYSDYSCKQLKKEMHVLSRRVSDLGGQVDKTASDDNGQMAVGMILFWPALFFLDGDTPQANEYGRLKGEFEALEKAAIQKDCDFEIERPIIKTPEPVQHKNHNIGGRNRP